MGRNRKQIKRTTGIVEKERVGEIKKCAEENHSLSNELEVFGYFNKYYSGHPPTDAKQLLTYLKNLEFHTFLIESLYFSYFHPNMLSKITNLEFMV